MPGVTDALPVGPLATLMALPEGNQYRLVAERRYRPTIAPDDAQWERCLPLLVEILAADPKRFSESQRLLDGRRAALARHVYWLAGEHPDKLNPDFALDEVQLVRSALNSEGHTTERSQTSYRSQIRSFRSGFPELFPVRRRKRPGGALAPLSDADFAIAWQGASTFRSEETCRSVQGMLLLARAAGVDGLETRYVAGTDVVRMAGAGLWVRIDAGRRRREVPVLARFQGDLERLARRAGSGPVIGGGTVPTAYGRSNELSDMLKRRLRPMHPGFEISCVRLRKAWVLEQLSHWPELQIFLRAAGLKSMHGLEDLMSRCPVVIGDARRDAVTLGGLLAPSASRCDEGGAG
ncbi:MAG: hypothetical protein M0027_03265 [Candidatus Dormibacteraeota bacterium]|nr:hypothetical protein [Candidatus Dormibacteraeota bacterium]